jgi:acetyl esterase/lipase
MSNSRHLVDAELLGALDYTPPELSATTLAAFREFIAAMDIPLPELPAGIDVTVAEVSIPGPAEAPSINLRIIRPSNAPAPSPAIFHIHGGGYVTGTAAMSDYQNRRLAAELGCPIVSVDYRLPPETPHPGPIEDCYVGLKWVHDNAETLGIDPGNIGLMGESAGGGLVAALALLVRDRQDFIPSFQHMMAPMLDDRTASRDDPHPYTGEFFWTREQNAFGWSSLLGKPPGSNDVSPYAAAARASDLSGLPAAFIAVGSIDLFFEESLDYARRLTRDGVGVELHVYRGGFHGFELATESHAAQSLHRDRVNALRRALQS